MARYFSSGTISSSGGFLEKNKGGQARACVSLQCFRSHRACYLSSPSRVLLKLLLCWQGHCQAVQWEISLHAETAHILIWRQMCGQPSQRDQCGKVGDMDKIYSYYLILLTLKVFLYGFWLQGDQLYGKTRHGGHDQNLRLPGPCWEVSFTSPVSLIMR